MKVKDLAVIFKTSTSELLNLLSNVGVDIKLQEETMVEKDVEKKLAKRYNVSYPFTGTVKNKPVNRVVIPGKTQPKVAPPQEQKEQKTRVHRRAYSCRVYRRFSQSQSVSDADHAHIPFKHGGSACRSAVS